MVHWPEVMVAYEDSQKVLFSADGFGNFGSLTYTDAWADEARRYYCNIVGKYGVQVQGLLKKAAGAGYPDGLPAARPAAERRRADPCAGALQPVGGVEAGGKRRAGCLRRFSWPYRRGG